MKILALDLGKSKTVCCLLETDTNAGKYTTIKTVPLAVVDVVERLKPHRVVLEVGTQAGWVHDVVVSLGVEVQVANPTHEGWRWRNVKRKTDRLDALKLAKLSAVGQLPQVYMPSLPVREHRALIAYRGQLVDRLKRIKNTIRSLFLREGLFLVSGASAWSRSNRERLGRMARGWEELGKEALWRGELGEELGAFERMEEQLVRVERKLDELGRSDERIVRVRSIPCVGPRTAELLVAVIDDPHRFSNGKQVGSYVGLVPRQHQSGQTNRQGGISKQGHRQLRALLVEVSWLALRYNPPLRGLYERLCHGSRSRRKQSIVAVARRLLIVAWAMLRDGTCWKPQLWRIEGAVAA